MGPHTSSASPPTAASRPASTVTRNPTVLTAVMSLAAVSGDLGVERAWRSVGSSRFYLIWTSSRHSLLLIKCFCPTLPSPVPPQVVTPPQQSIQASRGQTVTFTCIATGVPTPIINWRLNWGHIPAHPRYDSCGGDLPVEEAGAGAQT